MTLNCHYRKKEINRKCLTNENDLFHKEIQIKEIK